MNRKLCLMLVGVLLGCTAFADFQVDPVFSSNMVLQQERPIAFFGSADAGSEVKVEFAGKSVSAKPDAKGKWRAEFPAMKAGETSYMVKITDGKKEVVFANILIGDVWVCAGQSNMEMPIAWKFVRGWSAQNCEEEVKNANYPMIRAAEQKNVVSHNVTIPAQIERGGWEVCSPETAGNFSATGFFFARQLYKDLGLPVGLINLTWSGTCIQPWISREGYENAKLEQDLEKIRKFAMTPEEKAKYEKDEFERYRQEVRQYRAQMDALSVQQKKDAAGWSAPDLDDSQWKKAAKVSDPTPVIRWYRITFEIPAELQGKPLLLYSREPAARGFEAYLNGHKIGEVPSWEEENDCQTLNFTLKPEQLNAGGKNVLALRVCYLFSGDSQRQKRILSKTTLSSGETEIPLNDWKEKDELRFDTTKTQLALPTDLRMPYRGFYASWFFCNLYNGMVDAWTQLPVKGVIWYQGCSNAGQLHYYALHKALIADWRAKWHQQKMPFIIVQLAGYGDKNWQQTPPKDANYALTRDIQMQMLKEDNVGLACAIDIGEPDNIHPANKQEVGRRLALEAERMVYGKKIVSRGPVFDHAKIEGQTVRVFFENVPTGLKTGDGKAPGAFAIAGADRKFVWAKAEIDGKTVVVHSPEVLEPKYVRYAYARYRGDCNLQNNEGLPAYPFRSDAVDYSKAK